MSENQSISPESLLDVVLDELEDLPSYDPFAPGVYVCTLGLEIKSLGEAPKTRVGVEVTLTHKETQELANPASESPKAGDKCSTFYDMGNQYGAGAFKQVSADIKKTVGAVTVRDIVEKANGLDVLAVVDVRTDKTDADKKYLKIKTLAAL